MSLTGSVLCKSGFVKNNFSPNTIVGFVHVIPSILIVKNRLEVRPCIKIVIPNDWRSLSSLSDENPAHVYNHES